MKISNEIRSKIVEAYINKKMSKSDISVAFNVKFLSVHAILKVYQKEGRVEKRPFVPIKKAL